MCYRKKLANCELELAKKYMALQRSVVNNKGIALFAREQSVVMHHSNIDDNSTCESMTKYNITIT